MVEKQDSGIPEIEKLRSFKQRSSWTYEKISKHMGIHQQTIYFWFNGRFKPSSMALEKIRRFLDVYAY